MEKLVLLVLVHIHGQWLVLSCTLCSATAALELALLRGSGLRHSATQLVVLLCMFRQEGYCIARVGLCTAHTRRSEIGGIDRKGGAPAAMCSARLEKL